MVCQNTTSSRRREQRESNLSRKLAALAGATGAIAAGTDARAAITYTPTPGVAAASNIPGFTFVDSTNVTLGALRPPATPGSNDWDVDGDSTANFLLYRVTVNTEFNQLDSARFGELGARGVNRLMATQYGTIRNLAVGYNINVGNFVYSQSAYRVNMVANGNIVPPGFDTPEGVGQFGFSFTSGANSYFGWASLVMEPGTNTYKITEAYYSTTPGGAITVGAVPVPEPSSIALLAAGAAGVTAWRARRKKQPTGDA